MIGDLLFNRWNDILTILVSLFTVVLIYYQIMDMKARSAELNILEVSHSEYYPVYTTLLGSVSMEDKISATKYEVKLEIENKGREPTTISDMNIIPKDMDEKLEMFNQTSRRKNLTNDKNYNLDPNERRGIGDNIEGSPREKYPDEITATIQIDSTTGILEKEVQFSLTEDKKDALTQT
ncbi:hypothetical protein RH831_02285 [Halodesulfurarchaeum sp. HSR-GB]|uniref:hypothetical protein n=1 Tax=Halodesulfurarchaeum sp. HSR-GB TaxID=3074077 RepID=UPI002856AD3D|nr:hypothetical protein [Halodesulfurarchaeum sp. HSR-GB]MDR5656008.1 hypothetical protein [Halodesulfurarchaeum sp. HSR-GB]